jgi:RNA polymerase sigma factor (sigma-70 family)
MRERLVFHLPGSADAVGGRQEPVARCSDDVSVPTTPLPAALPEDEVFAGLFTGEYDGMVRLARLMLGAAESSQSCEEIVQEAFADVYRRGVEVFSGAYLRRAVVNGCLDHVRAAVRWRRKIASIRPHPPVPEPTTERVDIANALQSLSAKQRAAVLLRYYVDLPVDEIARALAVPPSTAKSLIRRGLDRLRREIGETPL